VLGNTVGGLDVWVLYNLLSGKHSSFDLLLVFGDRVLLYSPGCPGTHKPLVSSSLVLGLQACHHTQLFLVYFFVIHLNM
jgi:hypothetical protein